MARDLGAATNDELLKRFDRLKYAALEVDHILSVADDDEHPHADHEAEQVNEMVMERAGYLSEIEDIRAEWHRRGLGELE